MNEILPYFLREMDYLKKSGKEFAQRYPGIASALDFGPDGSRDPHVKQLLESFAFLTARVQRNIDESLGGLTASLLETIAPALVRPLPSVSILEMQLKPGQGKVTQGYPVKALSECYTKATNGVEIRFRTCWGVRLWPLKVAKTQVIELSQLGITQGVAFGSMGLAIDLIVTDDSALDSLNIGELDLYFDGDIEKIDAIKSSILARKTPLVWISNSSGSYRKVEEADLSEPGFERGQSIYPVTSPSDIPFSLLKSYATYSRAFNFLRVRGIGKPSGPGTTLRLVIALDTSATSKPADFQVRLGCTPVVNLFKRTSEPIDVDGSSHEFILHGDLQTARSEEVYAVNSVSRVTNSKATKHQIRPLAGLSDDNASTEIFWVARKEMSQRTGLTGTDTFIGFVNAHLQPREPRERIVYADLLCSNRGFAAQLSPGAPLWMDGGIKNVQAALVHTPSASYSGSLSQERVLKYLGFLTINRQTIFSLSENVTGAGLKEFLNMVIGDNPVFSSQVRGILSVKGEMGVQPIVAERMRYGLCSGINISIDVDRRAFAGGSLLVFGSVLSHVLAHFVNVNSFVRLEINSEGEVVHTWKPMTGYQSIL
jgi:type VI secretion system protein ImpG